MPPDAGPPAPPTDAPHPFPPVPMIIGVTMAALAAFSLLWADAQWDLGLTPIDEAPERVIDAVLGPERADLLGRLFSMPADRPTLMVVVPAAAVACVALGRWINAIFIGAYSFVGWLVVDQLKSAIGRDRPIEGFDTLAFPSGHASAAILMWGLALAFTLEAWHHAARHGRVRPYPPWLPVAALVLWIAVTVIVGLGRILLFAHWTTDVLGGWAIGLALLGAAMLYHLRVERRMALARRAKEAARAGARAATSDGEPARAASDRF